jgi:hypothetical protein
LPLPECYRRRKATEGHGNTTQKTADIMSAVFLHERQPPCAITSVTITYYSYFPPVNQTASFPKWGLSQAWLGLIKMLK